MALETDRTTALHLPSLSITNFRAIDHLSIKRLGRVTLLAGRNGVGKTSVLDAVRVFASRADRQVVDTLLAQREEFMPSDVTDASMALPDYAALFTGRQTLPGRPVVIGPVDGDCSLRLEGPDPDAMPADEYGLLAALAADGTSPVRTVFGAKGRWLSPAITLAVGLDGKAGLADFWRDEGGKEHWAEVNCVSLGPNLPSNGDISRLWDHAVLTEQETAALAALRVVTPQVEKVALVQTELGRAFRRVLVKLCDQERRVSLKSLGDGATRVFCTALALASSRDGFLLMDEVENGVHHSVQRRFWKLVFEASCRLNIQVLATTHSWDCVTGFARAAVENGDVDGLLVRLERRKGKLRAVEYSEERLQAAAEMDFEVR